MSATHIPQGNLIVVQHLPNTRTESGLYIPNADQMAQSTELPRCRVIRTNKYSGDIEEGDIVLLRHAGGFPITERMRDAAGDLVDTPLWLIELDSIAAVEVSVG